MARCTGVQSSKIITNDVSYLYCVYLLHAIFEGNMIS